MSGVYPIESLKSINFETIGGCLWTQFILQSSFTFLTALRI